MICTSRMVEALSPLSKTIFQLIKGDQSHSLNSSLCSVTYGTEQYHTAIDCITKTQSPPRRPVCRIAGNLCAFDQGLGTVDGSSRPLTPPGPLLHSTTTQSRIISSSTIKEWAYGQFNNKLSKHIHDL